MSCCCFTGHRNIKTDDALKKRLYSTLTKFIMEKGITDFYAGGAYGWDIYCEEAVLELRDKYPWIRLHLVLPCSPEDQTKKWYENDKIKYAKILKSADSVEVLSERYYSGCMAARNKKLVEHADCCICYYDRENHSFGGTDQTVKMAVGKGIKVVNLHNSEEIINE